MDGDRAVNGCINRAQSQPDGVGKGWPDAVELRAAFRTEDTLEIRIGLVGFEILQALDDFEMRSGHRGDGCKCAAAGLSATRAMVIVNGRNGVGHLITQFSAQTAACNAMAHGSFILK